MQCELVSLMGQYYNNMNRKLEIDKQLADSQDQFPFRQLESLPKSTAKLTSMRERSHFDDKTVKSSTRDPTSMKNFKSLDFQKRIAEKSFRSSRQSTTEKYIKQQNKYIVEPTLEELHQHSNEGSPFAIQLEQRQYQNLFNTHRGNSLLEKLKQKEENKDNAQLQKKKKKKKWNQLKQVITQQKINNIIDIFAKKIRRNNVFSKPVQYEGFVEDENQSIWDQQGWEINQCFDKVLSIITVIQMFGSLFAFTLGLVYQEIAFNPLMLDLQVFSIILYVVEIVVNLITVRSASGRKLIKLRDIGMDYLNNGFIIDLINLVFQTLSLTANITIFIYLRLFLFAKLSHALQKVERLEIYFIQNYYNEQYWSLLKVFLFNFCFAHMLAIFLTAMTNINIERNWMVTKGIDGSPWYQKYIWSYYWGTTVMLTVGFGDIVATTYQQALCLIFIETISCVCLAYNINCVGTLISNIRQQDLQKSKNFKMFKKLASKNDLPQPLTWRINNYIDQSINIKKKFSLEEEKLFVDRLPHGFRKEFLKESNRKVFQNIQFFSGLMDKTLYSLAERIEMYISHPQQIIQPVDDNYNLHILKTGQVGYTCKRPGCSYNDRVIDQVHVSADGDPFLINLNFILKKRPMFQVKALVYSIMYYLQYQKLIEILKQSQMDYEMYAFLRDKNKTCIDEFEVMKCENCQTKHTKFLCPKLHFIPFSQLVVNRFLYKQAKGKNKRNKKIHRIDHPIVHPLLKYSEVEFANPLDSSNKSTIKTNHYNSGKKSKNMLTEMRKSDLENPTKTSMIADQGRFQKLIVDNTAELLKVELGKMLKKKEQDEVWTVNCDHMKNYKDYFGSDNSSNLHQKFRLDKRAISNPQQTQNYSQFTSEIDDDLLSDANDCHIGSSNESEWKSSKYDTNNGDQIKQDFSFNSKNPTARFHDTLKQKSKKH